MADAYSRLTKALATRYRLERELGSGGMATVYLAEDLKHHRKVAVKVLKPELAATLGAERFTREIETAAAFQHPHILPLLDSGHAGGFLYYVMPYVEGESLRERLARHGELPIHDAVKILIEVADALAYAHARGVVHRDVKPDNVLLSGRHALVMDFGVAKAVSEAASGQSMTTTGVAIGTPTYMAPEQASADPQVDSRADIYALGVLGYELIAGRPPFTGKSAAEILAAQVTQTPAPLARVRPACASALEQVIMQCLEKRPADRWQNAEELLAALEPLATPSGGTTPTLTRPLPAVARRKTARALVSGAVVVAVAAGLLLLMRRPPPLVQLGRRAQVTLDPGLELDPALSPDGKLFAYVAGPSAGTQLFVRQVDGGAPVRLLRDRRGGGWQRSPAWSPDGRRILYVSERGIEIVPALGGAARLLVPAARITAPGPIASDGGRFVFAAGDSVYVASLDGGAPRLVTTSRMPHSFAWSPDGNRIAFVSGNLEYLLPASIGNIAPSSIWTVATTGGAAVRVTDAEWSNVSPVWTRTGRALLYLSSREGGRDVFQQQLMRSGSPSGRPARLTTGLNAMTISLAADGTRLAYAQFTETSNVWSLALPTTGALSIGRARAVTTGNQTIENVAISPDGRWVAFDSNRNGLQQIFRAPIAGGEPEALTNDSAPLFAPVWSPDSREIAAHGFRAGHRQIFVVSADGGALTQVTSGATDHRNPFWGANPSTLFMTTVGTESRLETISRDSGGRWSAPRRVAITIGSDTVNDAALFLGVWSPDGRHVLWGGLRRLIAAPATGGQGRVLRDEALVAGVAWSADGRWVYYLPLDSNGVVRTVAAISASGGSPSVVVRFDDPTRPWHRYGIAMHGTTLYLTLGDLQSDIWVAEVNQP